MSKGKKVLITGINGFVGRHCLTAFSNEGFEVDGLTNTPVEDESIYNTAGRILECDLSDPAQTARLSLDGIDTVLNLAGFATNAGGDPELIHKINVGAHVNLYRRIAELGMSPRIIAVSSGAVYDPNQPMPETEYSALKDPEQARPYEASKIHMEEALVEFTDLDIVIARPFNHIGPGQNRNFVVPDFAHEINLALVHGTDVLVGSLTSKRDYTDVRDVADAYVKLATTESIHHDVYNICSGKTHSGQEILDLLMELFDAKDKVEVREDLGKLRGAADMSEISGSSERLHTDTGWIAKIDFEQTISDFVDWYRVTYPQALDRV